MTEVKKDFLVKVHYTGKFEDGNVFDSSEGKDPLEIIAGAGMLIKGFDEALIGMKKGEEKDIEIKSEDAYGAHNPSLIQSVPKTALGKDMKVEVGMTLGMQVPNTEHTIPVRVTKVTDETVELDANHPLAGKNLKFHIKLIEAREATEEDKKKFMPPPAPEPKEEDCSGDCGSCGQH